MNYIEPESSVQCSAVQCRIRHLEREMESASREPRKHLTRPKIWTMNAHRGEKCSMGMRRKRRTICTHTYTDRGADN